MSATKLTLVDLEKAVFALDFFFLGEGDRERDCQIISELFG